MPTKVIINSAIGFRRSRRLADLIRESLPSSDCSIALTEFAGHATALARAACSAGFDTLVAVGGDGTVNEIVNGVIGANVRIGIVPVGTANDLARYHQIPLDPESACRVIADGCTRALDAIRVNGWHFVTVAGLGLPCGAVKEANYLRNHSRATQLISHLFGSKLYLAALALIYKRYTRQGIRLRLRTAETFWRGNAFSVIVANQPSLGRSFLVSPAAANDDGLLDLFAITETQDRHALLQTVTSTVGGHRENPHNVIRLQSRRLHVETSETVPFFGDGELHGADCIFDFEVVPSVIKLLVPPLFGEGVC